MELEKAVLAIGIMIYRCESMLEKALSPVCSIIGKCKKAQAKYEKGTSQYMRYGRMTAPMDLAKALIEEELKRKGVTDGRSNS